MPAFQHSFFMGGRAFVGLLLTFGVYNIKNDKIAKELPTKNSVWSAVLLDIDIDLMQN